MGPKAPKQNGSAWDQANLEENTEYYANKSTWGDNLGKPGDGYGSGDVPIVIDRKGIIFLRWGGVNGAAREKCRETWENGRERTEKR